MCSRSVVILLFVILVIAKLQRLHGYNDVGSQQCQCLMVTKGQPYVQNAQPVDQQNIGDKCFPNVDQLKCDFSYPYRYIDGRCNNQNHPTWGMTNSTSVRLLPAVYSTNPNDAPGTPRRSAVDNVTPLQSSRTISSIFFPDRHEPSRLYTLSFMIWSQIYSHDVLSLKLRNPPPTGCCASGVRVPPQQRDPGCLAIDVASNDDFYKNFNVQCFSLTRGQFSSDFGCNLPEIEQALTVTSYFDGSVIYGAEESIALQLRLGQEGKLKFETTSDGRVFLPHMDQANALCFVETNKNSCFQGSDFRVNQHPQLSVIQVILLRVHNKLCDELRQINKDSPVWQTDEKLYQEAKRIVTAILQHSIFGRFSEIFFGPDCALAYGLSEGDCPGYSSGYDAEINPTTLAEFEHVAWRAFHSLIEGQVLLYDDARNQVGSFQLSDWVNNPTFIKEPGNLDRILIGMCTQAMEGFDQFYSPEITEEFLKQINSNKFGIDLLAIDCERGRDCGIQPYIYFATLAGYPVANDFADLADRMDQKIIERLQKVYPKVQDIDALVGAILEKPYGGGMVGKTLLTVVAEQFRRHKFGDYFFYSFQGRGEFTPEQLAAIKSTTLAFLICYGSDNIQHMQRDVYTIPNLGSQQGQLEECSKIVEEFLCQLRMYWKECPVNNGGSDVDIDAKVVTG